MYIELFTFCRILNFIKTVGCKELIFWYIFSVAIWEEKLKI